MEWIEIQEEFPETLFRQGHIRTHNRPHLSRVLRDLEMTLEPDKYSGTADWDLNAAAQIGVLWEMALERAYRDRFATDVGEIACDGIVGTPDGINADGDGVYVEEYKLTWRSSRTHPKDIFYYLSQGMAYCHMVGTNRCRWHILHVMGDYRGSGPQYKQHLGIFTPRELEENWQMIVNHARHRGWL